MILGLIDEAVQAGARRHKACEILGLSERTVQRWLRQGVGDDRRAGPLTRPLNKLSDAERDELVKTACSPEFRDLSPWQIVPRLADMGLYLASEATFYRVLRERNLVQHRARSKAPREATARPLPKTATGPCQVWSWDITYVPGPVRGQFFYLYMILDVWSRKIVGWAFHGNESAEHAADLMSDTCAAEGVTAGQVILHSDNGGPMKGATMVATLDRLGVAYSFSRPRVSDDNPFSESLFRTAKTWRGSVEKRFASLEDATAWATKFVQWYNHEHLHSAIGFVAPADRHAGRHVEILDQRARTYAAARLRNPERFTGTPRDLGYAPVVTLHSYRDEDATSSAA
jgi:transposase InsO family protein